MNSRDDRSTTDAVVYCPVEIYFFAGYNEKEFNYLYLDDDDIDVKEAAKLESGQSAWADTMKDFCVHAKPHMSGIKFNDERYKDIESRVIDYDLGIEIRENHVWLSVKYTLDGQEEPDMALLKEYAAKQLIVLAFEASPWGIDYRDDGVFVMKLCPADYYYGPNQYDIEGNHLLQRHELPEKK